MPISLKQSETIPPLRVGEPMQRLEFMRPLIEVGTASDVCDRFW